MFLIDADAGICPESNAAVLTKMSRNGALWWGGSAGPFDIKTHKNLKQNIENIQNYRTACQIQSRSDNSLLIHFCAKISHINQKFAKMGLFRCR
ncbi:hypothetical protein EOE18_02300 [Novosphingobium umbonatum]|uniref:Uncharacterized protein n=1 Tax=Novosphingobium umbonatum TaxID=1908524 RepID=A0A437NDB0_9SPHN|nr:hypothetical protein [Novosphingobium umbonatum]RVU07923.1 hypothetical protein EOE18_02300 [Novosphingobium umbonatum]